MERLTERDKNGTAMAACCGSECKYNYCCEIGGFSECGGMDNIIDRLAAIEDILGDEYDMDRLRELVEADREQRCFVFRFGFGSTVYRTWIHPSGSPTFITENKMDTLNDLLNAETWDNAYSTRAEAEAAFSKRG